MNQALPKIAIVGRTNVGKSTLFNALMGHRKAVVEDQPGVTRDRTYATVRRDRGSFILIDTGGVVGEEDDTLLGQIQDQVDVAVRESDIVLGIFDGRAGVTPHDKEVVERLRRSEHPILWVVNKCEGETQKLTASEFYGLGVDSIICISAAHRLGLHELFDRIYEALEAKGFTAANEMDIPEQEPEVQVEKPIRVAIVGRPNVGKSTLLNRLVGEERLVTSPIAGTTRDSVDINLRRDGREYILVDTAGLRKKQNVDDHTVERYGNLRTLKSLVGSDVVVLVIDAIEGLPSLQEKKIAAIAHERGKTLVIAVNKWDAVEKDHKSVKAFTDGIYQVMNFARYAPVVFVSALTGRRCPNILDTVERVYTSSRERVKTSDLNRVLKRAIELRPPPINRGDPFKLFFATQIGFLPPTIAMFVNRPNLLKDSYERYMRNSLRREWPFEGTDIKFELKKRRSGDESNG